MSTLPGSVMLDLTGSTLQTEERELLQHPLVGGVILFSRNYEEPAQLAALCKAIRQARSVPLLIAVDQEGGRVQRFKTGFTRLPSMGQLGHLYETSPKQAEKMAETCGWLMAAEMLSVGIDLSFAPVLDLDRGANPAIGDRAFHAKPTVVIPLAKALIRGMQEAGMAATGKHFPGHGGVHLDSHVVMPEDSRSYSDIAEDLQPFIELIAAGLAAIMPAHILFSAVDDKPVGFSRYWLQTILREKLHFSGVIFSDDLNMQGAAMSANYAERAQVALEAGCDMALICNNRQGAIEILDQLPPIYFLSLEKFQRLQGKSMETYSNLRLSCKWKEKQNFLLGCTSRVDSDESSQNLLSRPSSAGGRWPTAGWGDKKTLL